MRRVLLIIIFLFLPIAYLCSNTGPVYYPPHTVEKLVKIIDSDVLKKSQKIIIYAYHTGILDDAEIYEVDPDEYLNIGYKRNDLYIYWAYDNKFNPEDIALDKSSTEPLNHSELHLLSNEVRAGNYTVPYTNPLEKEEITYSVYYENNEVRIYLSKWVKWFDDNTQTTEEYTADQNVKDTGPDRTESGGCSILFIK